MNPPPCPTEPALLGFQAVPLPSAFAERVRATLRDDFNRTVSVITAAGGEPLRDQLRRAAPGERIILCSYQSVPLPSLFAETGPVYLAAEAGDTAPIWRDELPPGYFPRTLSLRAYDAQDRITESAVCEPDAAPGRIRALLARPGVSHVHARFAGHGCFACRFDRTD